jgi:hypothetical protein
MTLIARDAMAAWGVTWGPILFVSFGSNLRSKMKTL